MVPTVPANVKAKFTLLESAEMAQSVRALAFMPQNSNDGRNKLIAVSFPLISVCVPYHEFHAK